MLFLLPFKLSNGKKNQNFMVGHTFSKPFYYGKTMQKSRFKKLMKMQKKSDTNFPKNKWVQSFFSTPQLKNWDELEKWKKMSKNVLLNTPTPSVKDESWRFTPLSKLFELDFSKINSSDIPGLPNEFHMPSAPFRVVYTNGIFSEKSSSKANLPENIFFGSLRNFDQTKKDEILNFLSKGESGIDGGFFPLLNMSCLQDVVVLRIPEETVLSGSLHVVFAGCSEVEPVNFNPRLVILGGKNSNFSVIEHHISINNSKHFDNSATSILLEKNSKLDFTIVNEISQTSSHIGSIYANCKKGSVLNFKSFSFGGFLSRINLGIDMNGIGASCKVQGLTVAKETQISDFHSRISHNFPKCQSSQLQKNLVTGKAQGIFAGKIQVQHGAFETDSDQLCKTLLLSSKARIDALPILEINNENVKCTHGSTVSDLDENQLFYFQSRGIPQKKARYLLTIGFVNEMLKDLPEKLLQRFLSYINSFL